MPKKIIWPISPIESTEEGDRQLKDLFSVLNKEKKYEIQPVYVLSSDYYVMGEYFEPIDMTELTNNLRRDCVEYLKKFELSSISNPVILENQWSSKAVEVNQLVKFVSREKPHFVVMSSHGRSGWARAFLGSFAENFLLQTSTPTIVLGPKCNNVEALDKALMPVQLDQASQTFIEKFLDDHRLEFVNHLTLFHKISMLDLEEVAWAPSFYGLGEFTSSEIVSKAKETTENFLNSFKDHPLSEKRLHSLVSEELISVPASIEKQLKDGNFDWVVMKTESGTLEANLLGSVAREVVRNSSKPVLVYPYLFGKDKG